MMTPPDEPYDLHLPSGTKSSFMEAIAEIPPDKRTAWRYHRVQPDDTLAALARTYHVSAADIAFVNQIKPTADISGEDALIIPTPPPAASGMQRSSARYRVESEDTLVTLADRFNVTDGTTTPLEPSTFQRHPAGPDALCSGTGARFRLSEGKTWPSRQASCRSSSTGQIEAASQLKMVARDG